MRNHSPSSFQESFSDTQKPSPHTLQLAVDSTKSTTDYTHYNILIGTITTIRNK